MYQEAQERTQEIRRLNEFANRTLDSNPSAIAVVKGNDHTVVSANKTFCQSFGLDEQLIEGRPLSEVLTWVGLGEIIRESTLSPIVDRQREMKHEAQDGSELWFAISAVPVVDKEHTDSGGEVLLVLNDITEQRRQQQRLQEQSRLASVGELAAGVAHEINNPLAAINGLSELLQMEDLPEHASEDVRKIQAAAKRAAKIVQNLLSFARKEAPEKLYLGVAAIVNQAAELKAYDFRLNNIEMTTDHSNRVPRTMMDEYQMIQVILNILTNAEQAIMAGKGGREITATTRLVQGAIRISIGNEGVGIPAENLNKVFDPFFTTKDVGEGTGLGLSICYGIVREHGGDLWAESVPGGKTTFHIQLPVLAEDIPNYVKVVSSHSEPALDRRILVVDDEPVVRETLVRVLTAEGHDVLQASGGE